MAINLKKLSSKEELLAGGHAACAGCTGPTVIRQALLAAEVPVVASCATGCMEVVTTIFPHTASLSRFQPAPSSIRALRSPSATSRRMPVFQGCPRNVGIPISHVSNSRRAKVAIGRAFPLGRGNRRMVTTTIGVNLSVRSLSQIAQPVILTTNTQATSYPGFSPTPAGEKSRCPSFP